MKIHYALAFTALLLNSVNVSAKAPVKASAIEPIPPCEEAASPVIPMADVNADGIVDGKDILILKRVANNGKGKTDYLNLYNRDSSDDNIIDHSDVYMATLDMNKESSPEQQALAVKSIKRLNGDFDCTGTDSGGWDSGNGNG